MSEPLKNNVSVTDAPVVEDVCTVETLKEADEVIRQYELQTTTKFSCYKKEKGFLKEGKFLSAVCTLCWPK